MGEGFTAKGDFRGQQCDEAEHGHAAIQLFSPFMETPALFSFHHLHAGFRGKGIQTTAIFGGHRGATNHLCVGGGRLSHDVVKRIATQCKPVLRNVFLVASFQLPRPKRRWHSSSKAGRSRNGYSPAHILSPGSQASLKAPMLEKSLRSLRTRQRISVPRRID